MIGRRLGRGWMRGGQCLAAIWTACVCLFPLYWALITSLREGASLLDVSPWPHDPSLGNYARVFTQQPFGRNILNSALAAGSAVAGALGAGVCASYALGRVRFRGRKALLACFLAVSMFPQVAILAGLFELVSALGLYNHWSGLALSYLAFSLPFTVWTLTSYVRHLPRSLEDAARIDGASPWTTMTRIYLPLMAPGFVTTGVLAFIFAWNEFLFALTLTLTDGARTVPVAIALMSGSSQYQIPWGDIMAASMIVTLPLLAGVLALQRRIVSGLTAGAVKH